MIICPVCKRQVNDNHFACVRAGEMGRMKSKAKTAACKRNILKRWKGHIKKKAAEEKDVKENIVLYYKKHFKPI